MAITNIKSSIPEDVLNAAQIALNKDVTTANDVGNGVMFGGNHSYEDDDWVKIVYDAEGNTLNEEALLAESETVSD
jgi:hypothetical protein